MALAIGDPILLMNDDRVIRSEYQIELADRVVELAAVNTGQDPSMDRYIKLLA